MTWTCTHESTVIGLHIFGNGSKHVVEICQSCEQKMNGGKSLSKSLFDINQLPVLIDDSESFGRCSVKGCTNKGADSHHIAPRHIFKDDADSWPKVQLCREHHAEWHAKVTPKMADSTK